MMDKEYYRGRLDACKDIPDVFELVKETVLRITGMQRGGLMLALTNLGADPGGFVGAYYPLASNIIVMNSIPLTRIKESNPLLYRPYLFHILLHEYLHSLGMTDEGATRTKVYGICRQVFGEDHPVTKIAEDISRFIPQLIQAPQDWTPPEDAGLQLVKGFDRSSTDGYIS